MASQDWAEKDFYKILGVAKDASDADIKKAYRKLARKYHPDTNSGNAASEKNFKDISEAYSVLSDAEDRQQYDAIRAMGGGARFAPGGAGAVRAAAPVSRISSAACSRATPAGSGGFNLRRIPPEFADLFGGGGSAVVASPSSPPRKGADRTASTTISFAGSISGTKIGLREPNGEVIDVRIPAGIKDGQKVRVKGKGQSGAAGPGDLMVTVNVKPHDFFVRDGDNIRIHVPVTFPEAALGADIRSPRSTGTRSGPRSCRHAFGAHAAGQGPRREEHQGHRRPAGDDRRRGPPEAEQGSRGSRAGLCSGHRRRGCPCRPGSQGQALRSLPWPSTSTSPSL